jgi:hypothetical protein
MLDAFEWIIDVALREFHCGVEQIIITEGEAAGADTWSRWIAEEYGMQVDAYPANWKIGRRAGPIRNDQMIATFPDVVAAFHRSLLRSKGTRDCVVKCVKRGFRVRLFGDPNRDCHPLLPQT